jgi:Carboxypeptidase regulatory-like domain
MIELGHRLLTLMAGALAVLALGVPSAALAQGPATIRGVVYSCATGAVVPSARVVLHGVDDGTTVALTTNGRGRFTKVGLAPGRYMISATPPLSPPWNQPRPLGLFTSSRMALLETDDVVDMRIGTRPPAMVINQLAAHAPIGTVTASAETANKPAPACDAPLVPLAPSTASRYIIR